MSFESDVIRHVAPLIAPSWSTVQDTPAEWSHLQELFPALSEVTAPLPDHGATPPVKEGPQPYDPRTDPDVLANGQDLDKPAPGLRLPKSLNDAAKKAIRALMPLGPARKAKESAGTSEARPRMTLACRLPGP